MGPVALLLLKTDIMSMISLFVHDLIKIDSLHRFFSKLVKDLITKLIFDWIIGLTEEKRIFIFYKFRYIILDI